MDLSVEVLAQILRYPTFDEDKIDLAKVQERSAISRRNDDPQAIGRREFRKLIYGPESAYARQEEYKTVNAVTRDDLLAFHGEYFHPENVQMAIWGDFNEKTLLKKIREQFADWKSGSNKLPPLPQVDYQYENSVFYVDKTDINQSNIYMGHIGGLMTDKDYAARIVMNKILGGGLGNRMFNTIRSKEGLAYATGGRYTSNIAYPGIFYNYTGTKSETTAKAVREMIKVIRGMQTDPPTADEMKRGKDSYLNSFVFKFDSKAEVVNRLMTYDFYGLPEDFLQREKEQVEAVTADDVVMAARNNLRPDKMKILVVGKTADFDEPLADLGLGPVASIDITIPPAEETRELSVTPENLSKGKELLAAAVVTHGGLANFKKINATVIKGTMTLQTPNGPFPLKFEEYRVLPDKQYQSVNVMGRTMYNISNGNRGWKTDQRTGGIVAKSEEDLKSEAKERARNNILIFQTSDQSEYQAVYDGTGEVGGKQVDFVTLLNSNGDQICRLGFDKGSHELVCKFYTDQTPMGEGTVEEVYTEMGSYAGVRLPIKMERSLSGQKIMDVAYSDVEINVDIPENKFEQPQ